LYKLVVLAIVLFIVYCAYLTLTDQPLPEIDIDKIQEELGEVTDHAKELKEKAGDTLEKASDTLDKLKN
jgi:hypothetical protein